MGKKNHKKKHEFEVIGDSRMDYALLECEWEMVPVLLSRPEAKAIENAVNRAAGKRLVYVRDLPVKFINDGLTFRTLEGLVVGEEDGSNAPFDYEAYEAAAREDDEAATT